MNALDRSDAPTVSALLTDVDAVFRTFDQQDSGCVSYGVHVAGQRWFLKAASAPSAVNSLRSAIRLHAAVRHPTIIGLRRVVETPTTPVLVYPWYDGEVLYQPAARGAQDRRHPTSPMARFRAQPVSTVLRALDACGWSSTRSSR